jgi:hypothetical protein
MAEVGFNSLAESSGHEYVLYFYQEIPLVLRQLEGIALFGHARQLIPSAMDC